jgi:hypothetical protein
MFCIVGDDMQPYKDGLTFPTLDKAQAYLVSTVIEYRIDDIETNPEAMTTILFSNLFSTDLTDVRSILRTALEKQLEIHPFQIIVGRQSFRIINLDSF